MNTVSTNVSTGNPQELKPEKLNLQYRWLWNIHIGVNVLHVLCNDILTKICKTSSCDITTITFFKITESEGFLVTSNLHVLKKYGVIWLQKALYFVHKNYSPRCGLFQSRLIRKLWSNYFIVEVLYSFDTLYATLLKHYDCKPVGLVRNTDNRWGCRWDHGKWENRKREYNQRHQTTTLLCSSLLPLSTVTLFKR